MPGLRQILKRFNVTAAGVSQPEPVLPLGIRDHARFDQLNRLISANWGEVPQDKIPDEVMIAVEEGKPVPRRRPQNEENPFAAPAKPKPKPRTMTPERIERRRINAKLRYQYRFAGKRKESE
jgi:hypothetical protein